jgi:hypothetical protein
MARQAFPALHAPGSAAFGIMDCVDAVPLRKVCDIADRADEIAGTLAAELHVISGDVDVQHIGATSIHRGCTKGDVDIAVRVPDSEFPVVVSALRGRLCRRAAAELDADVRKLL